METDNNKNNMSLVTASMMISILVYDMHLGGN